MPFPDTLVADLNSGVIAAVGARPDFSAGDGSGKLSEPHATRYAYTKADLKLSETKRLSCHRVDTPGHMGRYLHYEDGWTTVSPIDAQHPIVVSGRFSGCAYKVYKSGSLFYCAHIARAAGNSVEANVAKLADYAKGQKWTEIQSIGTSGNVNSGGCSEVMIVSQLVGGNINSILLRVNNAGSIVGKTLHTAPLS